MGEERLDDDTRDAVHDAVISHLQDNDGKLTDDFKEAVMTNYGTTEAECQQMVDACVATPIEFKLPQMSDWLIPRCFHYLDHTIPLEDAAFSEETPNDYSDMESFFKEFNEADEMGEFFKAAADTERVPTMDTATRLKKSKLPFLFVFFVPSFQCGEECRSLWDSTSAFDLFCYYERVWI